MGATNVNAMTPNSLSFTPTSATFAVTTPTGGVANAQAMASTSIQVGDNQGGSGVSKGDILKLTGTNQMPTNATITVNNSGIFNLDVGSQTAGILTLSGGNITATTGLLTLGGNVVGQHNQANQTPGRIFANMSLGRSSAALTRIFDISPGTLPGTDPANMVISGVISGPNHGLRMNDLDLETVSDGVMRFTGNNTYTGTTQVTLGTLLVDGSQPNSAVTVDGGTLGGIGTTGAVTVTSGTVSPGSSKGVLTTAGGLNMNAGGTLRIEVTGTTTPGTDYDRYVVTGALAIGASTILRLDVAGAGALTDNQLINGIVTYGSRTGTFAPTNVQFVNNPNNFQAILAYTANDIDLTLSGAATHVSFTGPSIVTAGQINNYTVTALNVFENTALAYTGTIHFTSNDPQADLPDDSTLTNGTQAFAFELRTAGLNKTLTATDSNVTALTGTVNVTVLPGPTTHYGINTLSTTTAGNAFVLGVTALDAFENTATNYTGTLNFTSSDPLAGLSPDSSLTNGVGFFAAILNTVGIQTLTVTDITTPTLQTTSNDINVVAAKATHFVFSSFPASPGAGDEFSMTVSARDQFNNTVPTYTGTVHFTSSDGGAVLPPNATLSSGVGSFDFTLKATGSQSITASDVTTPTIAGTQFFNVTGGAATHLFVSAPVSTVAGDAKVFTVTAQDQFDNTVPSYQGLVNFSTNDPQAFLQTSGSLTNGVGFFAVDSQDVGIPDDHGDGRCLRPASDGTSNNVNVAVAALHHFGFSGLPVNAITGTSFGFTVAAQDAFNNTVPTYNGTVQFTSNDSGGPALPPNSTLTAGSGTFNATFKTPGNRTLTATDISTPSITGTSAVILTRGLVVTGTTPTVNGFSADFNKPFSIGLPGSRILNLYDAVDAFGPSDVLLGRNAVQTITFNSVPNNTTFTLAFLASTTGPITYVTSAATLQTNIQNALNALGTVGVGNSLVTALSSTSVTVMFQGAQGFQSGSEHDIESGFNRRDRDHGGHQQPARQRGG